MGRRKFSIAGGADVEPASGPFDSYDGELPKGKVPYMCKLKQFGVRENKNGDDMLNFMCEIAEPKTKNGEPNPKAEYNGYAMWGNLNITDQGTPYVNAFLHALAGSKAKAVLKEFWGGGPRVDDDEKDKPMIVAIGTFKINPDGMPIICSGKKEKDRSDEWVIRADRFLWAKDGLPAGEADDDEDAEYADDEDEAEESEAEESEDDEYEARGAELDAMTRPNLVKAAKAAGITKTRGVDDNDLVEQILAAEFAEADEDEEDEADEEEPEEDEAEPESPAKPTRKRPAPAKAAATKPAARTRRSRTDDEEPPF